MESIPIKYPLLALIPLFPLLGAAINGIVGARLSHKTVHRVAILAMALAFGYAVNAFGALFGLSAGKLLHHPVYDWFSVGSVQIGVSFMVDRLSAVMILVITGVGLLIHIFSVGYMHDEPAYARYFAYLNLFVFFMLCLVMGDSVVLMFLGWEGVGLCSYLLIGFWYDDEAKAMAGEKAFIVNRVGDFGFLLGMFTIAWQLGALDYLTMQEKAASLDPFWAAVICVLLFVGAMGKSAQFPLYVWLPDAMAGPTPVSALIHAATMVTAGVFMVTRLNFLYVAAPTAMAAVAAIGAFTAFFAATIALVQKDIKKVLAYSTVSQLGYMFLGAGAGAFGAAVAHLVTHAFFKACLFLGSGSVIHGMGGEQDVMKMGGLRKYMPTTRMTFLIATAAIAGLPGLAGFFSKDAILEGAFAQAHHVGGGIGIVLYACWGLGVITAGMTAFYMSRLYFLTFSGEGRMDARTREHIHESPANMTLPLIVLAGLSVVGGLISLPFGFSAMNKWLAPMLAPQEAHHLSHALEAAIMVPGLLAAAIGFFIARKIYGGGRVDKAAQLQVKRATLHRWLTDKWYIDEFYVASIVRPMYWLAGRLRVYIDRFLIDGLLVNGLFGAVPRLIAETTRFLQNGDLGRYAFAMAVGIVAVLAWFLAGGGL